MKKKKLVRYLGTSWESLFNELIKTRWEKGEFITEIVLSPKASFPITLTANKKGKREILVYESDFGTHLLKIDQRYKGDKIILYGEGT